MKRIKIRAWSAMVALGILAVSGHSASAQDVDGSRPEPPAIPGTEHEIVESGLNLNSIVERLDWLESENQNLQSQLNGLRGGSQTTIINRHFKHGLQANKPSGIIAKVDYLRWAYRTPGFEYGITDIGGVQDRGAVGSVLSIDGEYDNGIRASIGYRLDDDRCNCLFNRPELLFTFTEFDTELFDRRIGSLRASFISADNSENNDSDDNINDITPDDRATSATARATLDYDVYDLEFAQSLQLTPSLSLRLSGGARATVINEHFDVTYTGGDFQIPYRAFRDWDYSGGGVLFGSELTWAKSDAFSFHFGAKGGAVLGRYESRHFFPDDEPGVPTDVRHGETRVNPFVEVNAGVQYQKAIGNTIVTIGAGYELVNWFNMADNRTFTESHIEGQNVNTVRDLSLDGMYARLGINY